MTAAGHNEFKFKSTILGWSQSRNWDDARVEWELEFAYWDYTSLQRECVCGHAPINQICVLKSKYNFKTCEVGNVCVRRFLPLAPQRVLAAIKRVKANPTKSLNPDTLNLALRRGVISRTEITDYKAYWRKRITITSDQLLQKHAINQRVLKWYDQQEKTLLAKYKQHGLKLPK